MSNHIPTKLALIPIVLFVLFITNNCFALAKQSNAYLEFIGTCDASAAIPLTGSKFVVAGDENSLLNIYDWKHPGEGERIDLTKVIPGLKEEVELDLEAATKIGDTTYWISSHSRTKKGELDLRRHIFFALKFNSKGKRTKAILVGKPYTHLLKDLVNAKEFKSYRFEDFSSKLDNARRGEGRAGFNIEGMSTWRGKELLLGLRGPLDGKLAILIPLKNPSDVVTGKEPRFGKPIKLDLDGYGIRAIEYIPSLGAYAILTGSVSENQGYGVYLWSGDKNDTRPKEIKGINFSDKFNPEAVFYLPGSESIYILSDDGNQKYHGIKCKDIEASGQVVFFRALKILKTKTKN